MVHGREKEETSSWQRRGQESCICNGRSLTDGGWEDSGPRSRIKVAPALKFMAPGLMAAFSGPWRCSLMLCPVGSIPEPTVLGLL